MPDFKLLPTVNGTDVALDGHSHAGSVAPVLWLDASQISGLADGAAVTTWPDSSGNGLDAAQASGGAKPTYKTGVLNGLPVVRFDGTADTMTCAAFPSALTQPVTTIVVCRTILSAITTSHHIISSAGGSFQAIYMTHPNKKFALYSGATLEDGAGDGPAVITAIFNGGSSLIAVNGAATTGNGGNNGWTQAYLAANAGGDEFFPGDIAEVLVYDQALDTIERRQVEIALAAKYGITTASAFASAAKWMTD